MDENISQLMVFNADDGFIQFFFAVIRINAAYRGTAINLSQFIEREIADDCDSEIYDALRYTENADELCN